MSGFFLCLIARNCEQLPDCSVSLHSLFYSLLITFYFCIIFKGEKKRVLAIQIIRGEFPWFNLRQENEESIR